MAQPERDVVTLTVHVVSRPVPTATNSAEWRGKCSISGRSDSTMTGTGDDHSELDGLIADAVGAVSSGQFDSILDSALEETSVETSGAEPIEPSPGAQIIGLRSGGRDRWFQERRLLLVAAAAVLCVGVGVGVLVTSPGGGGPVQIAGPGSTGSSTRPDRSTSTAGGPVAAVPEADAFSLQMPSPGASSIGALPPGVTSRTTSTTPEVDYFADLDILANDSGSFDRVDIVSPPAFGTVSWQPDPSQTVPSGQSPAAKLGVARYRPFQLDRPIRDSFTYRLVDTATGRSSGPVIVSVSLTPG